jgi:hypothetical protein
MHNIENSVACSKRATMPRWHPVIVFSPSIDTDMSLARQILIAPLSNARKWAIKLKMFLIVSQPHFGAKCEGEAHTPKIGKLESSRTPENSEFDCRGQISSHLSVFGLIEKVLKCRCPKWPCVSHLDICSPSYGQKKGRESNWQFDSHSLKVGNRPLPDVR